MKIGIFTSSTPIGSTSPERAKRAIKFLEQKGHKVILGKLFWKNDIYVSGNEKERAQEINDLIDQDVDLLLSAIGGYNTSSILKWLDFKKINKKKLVISGFSDTTSLLSALSVKAPNLRIIYGPALFPNFGEFEEDSREISYQSLMNTISNKNKEINKLSEIYISYENWEKYETERNKQKSEWKVYNPQKIKIIKGKVFGGNGNTLMAIMGSEYSQKPINNGILFIEDTDKTPAELERIFTSLFLNNYFKNIKGIILGKHNNFKSDKILPIDILINILKINNIDLPVLYDVDFSHAKPMLAIELFKEIQLDLVNKKILLQ